MNAHLLRERARPHAPVVKDRCPQHESVWTVLHCARCWALIEAHRARIARLLKET